MCAALYATTVYALIADGWQGCGAHSAKRDAWDPLFDLDVGEPQGLCTEQAGVFSRKYTKGTASVSCNSYTATLDFQLKPPQ